MLQLSQRRKAPPVPLQRQSARIRFTRPSLLDLRFTGDVCVVEDKDGLASVRLDNYRLADVQTMPFDVPSLNQLLLQMRQWQMRRCLSRRRRAAQRSA